MSSLQLQIGLRVSWKLCRNLSSRRWLRPNLIPLGLWQLSRIWRWSYKFQNNFLKSRKGLGISYFQIIILKQYLQYLHEIKFSQTFANFGSHSRERKTSGPVEQYIGETDYDIFNNIDAKNRSSFIEHNAHPWYHLNLKQPMLA